jgi:hypothetical protein
MHAEQQLAALVERLAILNRSQEIHFNTAVGSSANMESLPAFDDPCSTHDLLRARRSAVSATQQVYGTPELHLPIDLAIEDIQRTQLERNTVDFAFAVVVPFLLERLQSIPLQKFVASWVLPDFPHYQNIKPLLYFLLPLSRQVQIIDPLGAFLH